MRKLQAILFDLDGTLLDSAPDFLLVINKMLATRALDQIQLADIEYQVSNGARAMVYQAFKNRLEAAELEAVLEALKAEFLAGYCQQINKASALYPGVDQLLSFLSEHVIPWGIVTNKPELYTTAIVRHFSLDINASAIVCPDHVKHTKPNPEPLLLACQQMSVAPQNTWYVGDHLRDIQAGKAAGMLTIGCNYGYLNKNEKISDWNADYTVEHADQITQLIKQHSD